MLYLILIEIYFSKQNQDMEVKIIYDDMVPCFPYSLVPVYLQYQHHLLR